MGGPRVDPKTEDFIVQTWMRLRSDRNPTPSAKQVLALAEALIRKHQIKDIYLPKLRKVQQILAPYRSNQRKLPNDQMLMKDPWSMATLQKHLLPAQSLPAVMYVWRYTLITGEKFTIRQAKWVSRLWGFRFDPRIPDDALELWLRAYDYALKEEATLDPSQPLDTFQDDLSTVSTPIQIATIWKTMYGDKPFSDPFTTSIPRSDDGSTMHEVIHPLEYYNALCNGIVSNDRDKELHHLLAKAPSAQSLGLNSLEYWIVYLIWVTHIKQTPEWARLSATQAFDVIDKLRKWAVQVQTIRYDPNEAKPLVIATKTDDTHWSVSPDLPTPKEALSLLEKYAKEEPK